MTHVCIVGQLDSIDFCCLIQQRCFIFQVNNLESYLVKVLLIRTFLGMSYIWMSVIIINISVILHELL